MELHESGLNEKVQLATGQQLYPLLVFLEGKLPQYCAVTAYQSIYYFISFLYMVSVFELVADRNFGVLLGL